MTRACKHLKRIRELAAAGVRGGEGRVGRGQGEGGGVLAPHVGRGVADDDAEDAQQVGVVYRLEEVELALERMRLKMWGIVEEIGRS